MSRGNVIERGTHDELITQNGLYFSLMNTQENKKSEFTEVSEYQRKLTKKLSLEVTHNEVTMENNIKNDNITNTEDQMQYFDIFAYTLKLMELNKENIG